MPVPILDNRTTTANIRHAVGIEFKDQASYNKYRDMYLTFKNSLMQYAD